MFCTHCGQALTPGTRFCAACGTAVGSSANPLSPPAPPSPYTPPSIESTPAPGLPPTFAPGFTPPAAWTPPPIPPPAVHPSVGVYPMSGTSPGYSATGTAPLNAHATPANTDYAGFWRRFWGLTLDRIILGVLLLPVGLALGLNVLWPFASHGDMGPEWFSQVFFGSLSMWLVRTFAEWVYFAVFHSSSRQATPGQMLLGIHVSGLDGRRIGLGRASARYFASWLSAVTLCIGFIVGAFTERRQTLHDMIASTLVLRGRPS